MRVAIDTSSLLSLVRYYLPFDKDMRLYRFIEKKVEAKEILVVEEVYRECKMVAQGKVLEALPYLAEKQHRLKTDELLPDRKLFNRIENDFAITVQKRKLTEAEFENRKQDYMADADFKLILLALQEQDGLDPITIVTEESTASNDGKVFKKIPAICRLQGMDIACCDLPAYLKNTEGIGFGVQ